MSQLRWSQLFTKYKQTNLLTKSDDGDLRKKCAYLPLNLLNFRLVKAKIDHIAKKN